MVNLTKILQLVILITLLSPSSFAETLEGILLSIHDGDTLKVKIKDYEKPKNVRFRGVDTPEINFRGESQGETAFQARDFLRSLIPIGATVSIELGENSKNYNRLLGKIYYRGEDIGLRLIKEGLAVPYFIYPFEKRTLTDYQEAARFALANNKGFISSDMEMPYEFRIRVQNFQGTNYVGDSQTKLLYQPENAAMVPYTNRVFFKYSEDANRMGYDFP